MGKQKIYDDSFRRQVVDDYLSGASKYSLVKKYKLSGTSQIYDWLRIFGVEEQVITPGIVMTTKKEETEELRLLRLENKRLKKQLKEEELRRRLSDRIIEIAEDMYKVSLRKKPDTKP
ncbi:transposase [Bacteroidales bacterium OttesenSCG-928-J19]|nr:transposase [Bacteroidales bacterium OttesenSCG-928-J19]